MRSALASPAIHVVMLHLRWAVVHAGDDEPISSHDRREDAVIAARALADEENAEVVVFDLGGHPLSEEAVPPSEPRRR